MPAKVEPLQLKVSVPSRLAAAASSLSAALISWADAGVFTQSASAAESAICHRDDLRAGTKPSREFVVCRILIRTRSSGIVRGCRLSPRLAVCSDRDAVVLLRRNLRDVAGIEIALDQLQRPLGRRAITATAPGLDADEVAGLQLIGILLLDAALLRLAGFHERKASGLAFLAAVHAPGRILGAVEIGAEQARPQNAIDLAEAHAAAELAGAAGILAQRELLDAERHQRFLQLERNDAGVAVRHGAVGAGAVVGRAGAPPAMAAVVGVEEA